MSGRVGSVADLPFDLVARIGRQVAEDVVAGDGIPGLPGQPIVRLGCPWFPICSGAPD
jgi:hypothetical protein